MRDLENIFEKRLNQLGLKRQVDAAMTVKEAQEKLNGIFGEGTEKNLKVISFNRGVLKIAARTTSWANECQGASLKLVKAPIERIVYCNLIESS